MPAPPHPLESPRGDRLDSWKEIAAYLKRDVTTVQRWERREGMPVHRHQHDRLASVYAYRSDLDAWVGRRTRLAPSTAEADTPGEPPPRTPVRRWSWALAAALIAAVAALAVAATAELRGRSAATADPLAGARFVQLTDFDGDEQAAAISRDGRFVAFLSSRGGPMDVWVTQLGSGQFTNLTQGLVPELVNPSVRTLGFSPDGTLVTFWTRRPAAGGKQDIAVWASPLLGGPPRPHLDGVAELDWSADGARLVFHTPGPGDPTFVSEGGGIADARQLFSASPGLHAHFPVWSPDGAHVYFVQGTLPDHLDLWRIPAAGGAPERLTHHDALVSHPVFLDGRTLLYLTADPEGLGSWINVLDPNTGAVRRVGLGADRYTSLSASSDGARLVATRASSGGTLWRVPVTASGRVDLPAARRVTLPTGSASFPRLGPGYLLYVSGKGTGDGLWKLQGDRVSELWSAPDARILGAPAIRRDGGVIAFSVRQGADTSLLLVDADGARSRVLARGLSLRGAPAWTPDGRAVTVAALVDGTPHLLLVPLDGAAPVELVKEHALDPAWSPGGEVVYFSGPDVGTTFTVKAATQRGAPAALPPLTLTRGARHVALTPDGRSLLVLRGEIRHKDLWRVDLATGAEQKISALPPDFDLRDFDVSADGGELVLQEVREHSDVVLIERQRR